MNLIPLRNGPIVTESAVLLALQLEQDGHALSAKDGLLVVSNGSKLSAETLAAIKANRLHMLAIAAYDPPEPN